MARIKKGDQVIVIAGKDKGKTGRVLEVLKDVDRVVVEGVQRVTKHTKVGQSANGARTGGIETVEAPIHASNVMPIDPKTKKRTRVGFRVEEGQRPNGRKRTVRVRYAKKSGRTVYHDEEHHPPPQGQVQDTIAPALRKEFGHANVMEIPASSRSWSTWASARPRTTPR